MKGSSCLRTLPRKHGSMPKMASGSRAYLLGNEDRFLISATMGALAAAPVTGAVPVAVEVCLPKGALAGYLRACFLADPDPLKASPKYPPG